MNWKPPRCSINIAITPFLASALLVVKWWFEAADHCFPTPSFQFHLCAGSVLEGLSWSCDYRQRECYSHLTGAVPINGLPNLPLTSGRASRRDVDPVHHPASLAAFVVLYPPPFFTTRHSAGPNTVTLQTSPVTSPSRRSGHRSPIVHEVSVSWHWPHPSLVC